jgi:hypothetical protein
MDMMNRVYGELIGRWLGKYISVDVDEEVMAWGEELRIRVAVRVDQPLPRGVPLKESYDDEESKWFDLKYEKIPHFCFDCGCLIHASGVCAAGSEALDNGIKQWGEWLRASPKKSIKPPQQARPSRSGSFRSRSFDGESSSRGGAYVQDIPPRRNLANAYDCSSSSRTGEYEPRQRREEVSSPVKRNSLKTSERPISGDLDSSRQLANKRYTGTYVRRPRKSNAGTVQITGQLPADSCSKKRGSKQVWRPIPVQVIGEEGSEAAGKRQRTNSVFDRLDGPSASVFDGIEDPMNISADTATQGRRDQ